MAAPVAELDAALVSMLALKAPGVSGSKIKAMTELCNKNVQSESVLIQKIFTHFKKAPGTHKLGVLYVVDSVTRKWIEQANKQQQKLDSSAADGSYAAGVNRITELLPVLMNDITIHAPGEQKDKLKKLADIWTRSHSFPAEMVASFVKKIDAMRSTDSTTPTNSPPAEARPSAPASNPSETHNVLAALANLAKQATTAQVAANIPAQDSSQIVTGTQSAFAQPHAHVNQNPSFPAPATPVNMPGVANINSLLSGGSLYNSAYPNPLNSSAYPTQVAGPVSVMPQIQVPVVAPAQPAQVPASVGANENLQQHLQVLQVLAQQGVPQDQWGAIIATLISNGTLPGVQGASSNAAPAPNWAQAGGRQDQQSRDRDTLMRSPPSLNQRSNRDRSRSPDGRRRDRVESPPQRRGSPDYGPYQHDNSQGGGGDRRSRERGGRGRGSQYRERSPMNRRRSPSPVQQAIAQETPQTAKWVGHDETLGPENIKVMSRTLFVGGVTCTEKDLRGIFSKFGTVQTCIVNQDKRHGFVKMLSRYDAVQAKEGMEKYASSAEMQLRTRWGVGFGPRDCSDYQTGISIIPIGRLTDADRKWMLTAEYGGSGGKPIVGGMCVEEPDIEIGQGVSSKAISRRMVTDTGGPTGPRSTKLPEASHGHHGNNGGSNLHGRGGGNRFRQPQEDSLSHNYSHSHSPAATTTTNSMANMPLPVPGFGFPLMPHGMPMFPPGFVFPGMPPPPNS